MCCQDEEEADRCNTHPHIKSSCYKIIASTDSDITGVLPISTNFLVDFTKCQGECSITADYDDEFTRLITDPIGNIILHITPKIQ